MIRQQLMPHNRYITATMKDLINVRSNRFRK